jgi:hypothetical protein
VSGLNPLAEPSHVPPVLGWLATIHHVSSTSRAPWGAARWLGAGMVRRRGARDARVGDLAFRPGCRPAWLVNRLPRRAGVPGEGDREWFPRSPRDHSYRADTIHAPRWTYSQRLAARTTPELDGPCNRHPVLVAAPAAVPTEVRRSFTADPAVRLRVRRTDWPSPRTSNSQYLWMKIFRRLRVEGGRGVVRRVCR